MTAHRKSIPRSVEFCHQFVTSHLVTNKCVNHAGLNACHHKKRGGVGDRVNVPSLRGGRKSGDKAFPPSNHAVKSVTKTVVTKVVTNWIDGQSYVYRQD